MPPQYCVLLRLFTLPHTWIVCRQNPFGVLSACLKDLVYFSFVFFLYFSLALNISNFKNSHAAQAMVIKIFRGMSSLYEQLMSVALVLQLKTLKTLN